MVEEFETLLLFVLMSLVVVDCSIAIWMVFVVALIASSMLCWVRSWVPAGAVLCAISLNISQFVVLTLCEKSLFVGLGFVVTVTSRSRWSLLSSSDTSKLEIRPARSIEYRTR